MVNTKMRLIVFFAAKDGEALYSQQKQDQELTVAQIAAAGAKSLQSCLTLSDPMDCSPPGSSVHGIFQVRVLEWSAIAFSRGSDYELLIDKFRLKLKIVGTTTRPFRYALYQIPFHYSVVMRNRFKGLDLIECLMNYGQRFMTLYRR